ncbi:hypothetical protein MLD38_014626 [Melastoma candidum]|uniref:Uncharacterized protein n=1 Tax=Melastoma candidum TaxID=119954 RepID=A0ACB9REQ7_9MYRT|nr:hypothetical protein MLD38_014626 [Melastoma candidum]
MIKYNDAWVRVAEARAIGGVDEWLQDVDREELRLVHWEEMSPKPYCWSTFYILMTEFEEGGIVIALSCIHLLANLLRDHFH